MDPKVPQCSLQFWDVESLLPLHLVNYEIPDIHNRVEVREIVMSVNGVYVLFKSLLHILYLMSWITIMLKWRQLWIGQKGSVLLHCYIFGRLCTTSTAISTGHTSYHQKTYVFHHLYDSLGSCLQTPGQL